MLTVTDKAIEVIRDVCKGEVRGLRIVVEKGCSGFSYAMGLEDAANDDDEVVEIGEVALFVDAGSALWLVGATMDYVDDSALGAGFVFDNPNAPPPPPKGCSCAAGTCG